MTRISGFVSALPVAASVVFATAAGAQWMDFQGDVPGAPPKGFSIATSGPGETARWEIREDATSPSGDRVLVQTSEDETRARFPLAIYDAPPFADGAVAVRFKAISGEIDRAAGLVWRYRDPDNYYIVRANALEGNVVLYKVEGGKRSDLKPTDASLFAYGKKANVETGRWQELRVEFAGRRFHVFLDGVPLFDVEDKTFAAPGRVGLWTKADSVTAFDGLRIEPLEAPSPK